MQLEGDVFGIGKMVVGIVLFAALVVVVARYAQQLGAFMTNSSQALVTLGNGVANFGGSNI